MNKISLRNVRSLEQTPLIELKPLTVLLGKNSSGKSTFLRVFPLLKQSCGLMTRGVLAFYGDFVDFGEFKDIKTSKAKDDFIELAFDVKISEYPRNSYLLSDDNEKVDCFSRIKVKPSKKQDLLYITELNLDVLDNNIVIKFSEDGEFIEFKINGASFLQYLKNVQAIYEHTIFFPSFMEINEEKKERAYYAAPSSFYTPFMEAIKGTGIDKEIKERRFAEGLPIFRKSEMLHAVRQNLDNKIARKLIDHLKKRKNDDIYEAIVFMQFPFLIDAMRMYMFHLGQNIFYSKPLRANAERFYRSQSLTVNEISPDGSNLVPFINNLTPSRKNQFNIWSKGHFGFAIHVEKSGSHHSIVLEEEDSTKHNVTDMGFGFSQIIPIITQLWDISTKSPESSYRYGNIREIIYTIEQPELHLHPALQAKVIETFVEVANIARQAKFDIKIILETHSETIVNYLGKLVANQNISNNDISLVIFDKKTANSSTELRMSHYDKDGILENWPLGFFSVSGGK